MLVLLAVRWGMAAASILCYRDLPAVSGGSSRSFLFRAHLPDAAKLQLAPDEARQTDRPALPPGVTKREEGASY